MDVAVYLCLGSSTRTMQQIAFSIGQLLEATFTFLPALGWLPVIGFSVVIFLGLVYWMVMQARYDRKAKANNTLA